MNRADGPPHSPWQFLPAVALDARRQPRGEELLVPQAPRPLLRVNLLQLMLPRLLNGHDVVADLFDDVDQPRAASP
eukprot:2839658-Lingulodinium_polyedra.AAC.1